MFLLSQYHRALGALAPKQPGVKTQTATVECPHCSDTPEPKIELHPLIVLVSKSASKIVEKGRSREYEETMK